MRVTATDVSDRRAVHLWFGGQINMSISSERAFEKLMFEYINFGRICDRPPLVSVVVPTYNNREYLRKCIDSIIVQTLSDIEIICVNDGSTDGSGEILAEYAARDPRVKVINKPNTGYGDSMNIGIEKASGKYIGIVESDDYILPRMMEELSHTAEEHDLDLVKGDFIRFVSEPDSDLKKKTINICTIPSMYGKVLDLSSAKAAYKFPINTWAGIYRRSFLVENGIRHNETPGASYQDNGFWFQTFALAKRAMFVNRAYYMNRRDNPNSSVYSREKVFCMCDEYSFIRGFIASHGGRLDGLLGVYAMKMFGNYMATYNRIDPQYKLMFLDRFHQDMKRAVDSGEADLSLFDDGTREELENIIAEDYVSRQFAKLWSKLSWNREKVRELEDKLHSFEPRRALTIIIKTNDDYAALKKLVEITERSSVSAEFICARTEAPSQRFIDLTNKHHCHIVRGNSPFEAVSTAVSRASGKYVMLIDTVNISDEKFLVASYSAVLDCCADVLMPHLNEDPQAALFTAYRREPLMFNGALPDRYSHLFRWRLSALMKAAEEDSVAFFGGAGGEHADMPCDCGERYFSSLAAYTVLGLLGYYGPSDRPTKEELKTTILPMFGITMDGLESTDEFFQREISDMLAPDNKIYN